MPHPRAPRPPPIDRYQTRDAHNRRRRQPWENAARSAADIGRRMARIKRGN